MEQQRSCPYSGPYTDHIQQQYPTFREDRPSPLNSYRGPDRNSRRYEDHETYRSPDRNRRNYEDQEPDLSMEPTRRNPYTDHIQQLHRPYRYDDEQHYPPLNTYRGSRRSFPRYQCQEAPGDGVYMFIRFPTSNGTTVSVVRQTVVLAQRPVQTLGGRFVGIAQKIWEDGPTEWPQEAMVVFWFRSLENARTFFVSDLRIKQPDFPAPAGLCDAWAVVRFYTPPNEHTYNTFMISEAQLKANTRYEDYKKHYATPFAKLLLDHGAQPFVVQSVGAELLRRHYVPRDTMVTVHLFRDPAHLAKIRRDPTWTYVLNTQRDMAKERFSIFTIDPRACP